MLRRQLEVDGSPEVHYCNRVSHACSRIGKSAMPKRFIFVEPDAIKRDAFAKHFVDTRYQLVLSASTGVQALKAIERMTPGILVLSLDTPYTAEGEKGGVLSLLVTILDLPTPPRVIASCGTTTRELWPRAKRLGAMAAITENMTSAEILETFRQVEETGKGMDALRRRRLRLKEHLVGWYKPPNAGFFKKMQPATILDISGSGVGISTLENIPVGSSLKLNLTLPSGKKPIKTNATVMWAEPVKRQYRMGLRFAAMTDADREKLEAYIQGRVAAE